jgi:peptide/nickel transport system ATP-binding protein
MSSVPKLTGEAMGEGIAGSIPEYLDPPTGCRFQTRCPYAHDRCGESKPDLYTTGNRDGTMCFLYDKQQSPYEQPTVAETRAQIGSETTPEQEGE